MGCVYSKRDEGDKPFHGRRRKPLKKLAASSEGEDSVVLEVDSRVGRESIDGGRVRLIPEPKENVINLVPHLLQNGVMNGSTSPMNTEKVAVQERWGSHDGRAAQANIVSIGGDSEVKQQQQKQSLFSSRVANGALTEYAAAGWPYWLTKVAGEAVKGWLPRKLDSFANMEKIGQGTYSTVYKAHDLVTGQIVALKKVRFANLDAESIRFMAREIYVLRRLDHPNVIKLEGLVASKMSNSLWLIFQYMEHDLAGLAARPGISFSLSQVKCFMKQLFNGLTHCHNNGVLHRDIKGANLLINDDGILKLADFGLATFFSSEQKHPLTSRVVTLWYRPPELLLGAQDYGVSVDLWSAGCILAELLTGKPIMPGRTEVEQLHMIFKLCGSPSEEYWMKSKLPHATIFKPQHPYKSRISHEFKDFPTTAVQLLERLLAVDPADRGTSATLLSEFFTVEPIACDPSDLPKYPPSKELDAKKLRDVEFGRNKEATKKKNDHEFGREVPKYSKGMPVLEANAEFKTLHENSRSIGDKYNPREDAGMRNPDDRPLPKPEKRFAPPEEYGASMIKNSKDHHSSFGKLNNPHASRSQRSHLSNGFSGMSGPLENSRTSTKFAGKKESHEQSGHHRQLQGSSYSQLQTNGDEKGREPKAAYIPKRNRIMYSGPLIPTMDNIDEMLKEHERQIEQAVRKACNEKMKNPKCGTKGQPESLLRTGGI